MPDSTHAPSLAAAWRWSALAAIALALPACSPPDVVEIEGQRIARRPSHRVVVGAGHGARFGMEAESLEKPPTPPQLDYDPPDGWKVMPPDRMRRINLQPQGHFSCEAYLVALPGSAGGLVDNVNRWRDQMGLPSATPAEIEALDKGVMLGIWVWVGWISDFVVVTRTVVTLGSLKTELNS